MPVVTKVDRHQNIIATDELELTSLVGHFVHIYSEQFPGVPLKSRVVEARQNILAIDRSGGGRRIDNLVHNQTLCVQFPYKGERITVQARLKRSGGGKCNVVFADEAIALTRRIWARADLSLPTKLAVLPVANVHLDRLSRLRWVLTETVNFSSGGALLELSSYLDCGTILLMNIEQESFDFPALIAGRVRHSHQISPGKFLVGVEFVVDERKLSLFSETTVLALPPVVFEYDDRRRLWLNGQIAAWMQKQRGKETNGSSHEQDSREDSES